MEVQQEFDPASGGWNEVGRGSRWQPERPVASGTAQAPVAVDPEAAKMDRRADDAKNVKAAISEAKALVGPWSAGFVGQKLRSQGGTPAFDLNAKINTVKANIGFDRLQRMREESKTGGALGQVAVQELEMLQSVITSLDTAQSPEQLIRALDAVDAQYTKAMEAYEAAKRERSPGGDAQQWPEPPQAAIDALTKDPSLAPQFVQKYGRLPQGFSTRP